MNYLAHLYLADLSATSRIGNLLGDFVKGDITQSPYPDEIKQGIVLHRRIDRFTDSHPAHRQAVSSLGAAHRRVSPVLIDLLFDHFLARDWQQYTGEALTHYTERIYQELAQTSYPLPGRLQHILPHMSQYDWLGSYRTMEGIEQAMFGVSRRLRRPEAMQAAIPTIRPRLDELERYFHHFWPQLVSWTRLEAKRLSEPQ